MSTIADTLAALRTEASSIVARRSSDSTLYTLLGHCLEACEHCRRDPAEEAALRALVRDMPARGRNRVYVNRSSDVYQLVCRYVFDGDKHTANTNRYAITIRLAAERQIAGSALPGWLGQNGGVNALYMRRPLLQTVVRTKCLHLEQQITVPKAGAFTLTLRRSPENTYFVEAAPQHQ